MSYLSALLQATSAIFTPIVREHSPTLCLGRDSYFLLGKQRLVACLQQGIRRHSYSEITSCVDILFGLKMTFFFFSLIHSAIFFHPLNYSCLDTIGNDAFSLDKRAILVCPLLCDQDPKEARFEDPGSPWAKLHVCEDIGGWKQPKPACPWFHIYPLTPLQMPLAGIPYLPACAKYIFVPFRRSRGWAGARQPLTSTFCTLGALLYGAASPPRSPSY